MKAVVLAVALFGCWHFSGAEEPPPVESRGVSEARRDARGRADAGVADADEGDGIAEETGVQSTGGSLGGPGGPGQPGIRKGSGRPGPGWRRAPMDAGVDAGVVAGPPMDAGVMAVPPGCVLSRVISMMLVNSQLVLTIGAGTNRGVATSWTVTLPNWPQASVRIMRVDRMVTVVEVSGRGILNDLRGGGLAVLCP